jgi:hypothetical protein
VVLEMGMPSLGNILGNRLQKFASKKNWSTALPPGGTLILNDADDPGSLKLSLTRFKGQMISYGTRQKAGF